MPTRSQPTGKLSTYRQCGICKKRVADGLLGLECMVCYRKVQYQQLPPEQQEKLLLTVIPERYLKADMPELDKTLQDIELADIDAGVLLWGPPGVGKTYSMAAFAKVFIAEGFKILRTHYEELCLRLRDTFKPSAENTEWGTIEPLINCDKLFIEDVGTTKSIGKQETDFSLKTFLLILDKRMEHLRPTFITSNKNVENIGNSFDARVGDRLKTFQVYGLRGKSKR